MNKTQINLLAVAYIIIALIVGTTIEPRLLTDKAIAFQVWVAIIVFFTNDMMFPPPKNSHSRVLQFVTCIFITAVAGAYGLFSVYIMFYLLFAGIPSFGLTGLLGGVVWFLSGMIGFVFWVAVFFGIPALIGELVPKNNPIARILKDDK